MPDTSASPPRTRTELHPLWWLVLPVSFLAAQFALTLAGRDVHDRAMAGEFGFVELTTGIAALGAAVLGVVALRLGAGLPRTVKIALILMALGSFYFGGEELSWGQHIFGWGTPDAWAKANYQAETNLHNLWDIPLTNVLPRLALTLLALACLVLPFIGRFDPGRFAASDWRHWLLPSKMLMPTALLVLVPPLPRKLFGFGLPEPGETEELFMGVLLLLFVAMVLARVVRSRRVANW